MLKINWKTNIVSLTLPGFSVELSLAISRKIINFYHRKKQNTYDVKKIRRARIINLFVLPNTPVVSGGIQSIFSVCKYSRQVYPEAVSLITTGPWKKYSYSELTWFQNTEKIYRWEQIIKNIKVAEKLIIHLPEYLSGIFCNKLSVKEIQKLKQIKDLQINILNQNINLMPTPEEISSLKQLTPNITQTIAHDKYATRETCDKWRIPTHLLSVYIDCSGYKSYPFGQKEKIIALSPDDNEYRGKIIEKLERELPDFKCVTINDLTFCEYMDLIARSYFTITFGEGMDGYFLQPSFVGSVGIAVYNNEFFPNKTWNNLFNIYTSYDELLNNITIDFKKMLSDPKLYYQTSSAVIEKCKEVYSFEGWLDNLKHFYQRKYDFVPTKMKEE